MKGGNEIPAFELPLRVLKVAINYQCMFGDYGVTRSQDGVCVVLQTDAVMIGASG